MNAMSFHDLPSEFNDHKLRSIDNIDDMLRQNWTPFDFDESEKSAKLNDDGLCINGKGEEKLFPTLIWGLLINGQSEQLLRGVAHFQSVNVPWCHALYKEGDYSMLSALVGTPVICIDALSSVRSDDPTENLAASWLMVSLNPGETFGRRAREYSIGIGNVVVGRLDYKPATADYLAALTDFARYHIRELLNQHKPESTYIPSQTVTQENVLAEVNPETFEKFREQRRKLKESGRTIGAGEIPFCHFGSSVHDYAAWKKSARIVHQ